MSLKFLSFKTMTDLIDGLRDVPKDATALGIVYQATGKEGEDDMGMENETEGPENETSQSDMAEDAMEYQPPEEEMS